MANAAIKAQQVARARRNEKERVRKNLDGTLKNENEKLLRKRTTRMQRNRGAGFILQNYEKLAENRDDEEEVETKTQKLYHTFMQSEDYLYTM